MTNTQTVPTAAQVQAALEADRDAWTATILLHQKNPLDLERVRAFSRANPQCDITALGEEFEAARLKFNARIKEFCDAARARAQELSRAYALELFKTAIPGDVTLPYGWSGGDKTFHVESLERVHVDKDGNVSGCVRVSSHGGRCGSTENFYTRDGRLHFAEPDLY